MNAQASDKKITSLSDSADWRGGFGLRWIYIAAGLTPFVLIIGLLVYVLGPFPRTGEVLIVAKNIDNPNLKVVCTQEFTGTAEPYVVSLWVKRPGEGWRWLYVDHEDVYWWSGKIELYADQQGFVLYRGGRAVADVDLKLNKYVLHGDERPVNGDGGGAVVRNPPRIVMSVAGS